jgi:hypothetical protein
VSGNPSGRPTKPRTIEARRIVLDVRALARECAPEAISTLKTMMLDTKTPPAARLGAATALLDRGYGKPGQSVDVAVTTYDYSQLTDEQLDELEHLMRMIKLPSGESLAVLFDESKGGD